MIRHHSCLETKLSEYQTVTYNEAADMQRLCELESEAFAGCRLDIPYRGVPMFAEDKARETFLHKGLQYKLKKLERDQPLPNYRYLDISSRPSRALAVAIPKSLTETAIINTGRAKPSSRSGRSSKSKKKQVNIHQPPPIIGSEAEKDSGSAPEKSDDARAYCPRCAGIAGYDFAADKSTDYSEWYECSGCQYGVTNPRKRQRRDALMIGAFGSPGPESETDASTFAPRHSEKVDNNIASTSYIPVNTIPATCTISPSKACKRRAEMMHRSAPKKVAIKVPEAITEQSEVSAVETGEVEWVRPSDRPYSEDY